MKRFLFMVFVILITPIYLIICMLEYLISWLDYIVQPIAEGIQEFIENMTQFWKKILKQKGENKIDSCTREYKKSYKRMC